MAALKAGAVHLMPRSA